MDRPPVSRIQTHRAVLELVFAGGLWGFGFVAAVWTLRAWGPLSATGVRFALAIVVGGLISFAVPSLRRQLNFKTFRIAFVPGLLLSSTLVLQTCGLRYTTATKSGFITCLYVLIVPFFEFLFLKRRLPRFHFAFVTVALIGVGLICNLEGAFVASATPTPPLGEFINSNSLHWNLGDLLTLFCAFAASAHILWFGQIAEKIESPFVFNVLQTVWAAVVPISCGLIFEKQPSLTAITQLPIIGMAMLAFGSTLIAFALQIKAQKVIAPSLASLLFLLESPLATLFAIFFLNEQLRLGQWLGAGLILCAVILSSI